LQGNVLQLFALNDIATFITSKALTLIYLLITYEAIVKIKNPDEFVEWEQVLPLFPAQSNRASLTVGLPP
jgi:hypothetical protein